MQAGNTYWPLTPAPEKKAHLLVVISDPEQDPYRLAVVTLTSSDIDKSCTLGPRDHPFIRKTTHVAYGHARIGGVGVLEAAVRSGTLEAREPMGPEVLARIRQGAASSIHLPNGCRELLQAQGLLDDPSA